MPLISSGNPTGPPLPPEPPGGQRPNPNGTTVYTLHAADGTVYQMHDLPQASDGSGVLIMAGSTGMGAPPYEAYVDTSPLLDGIRPRSFRAMTKTITMPMLIHGRSRDEYQARKRNLFASLSPKRGISTLEIAEADGERRYIDVFSLGEGIEGQRLAGRRLWNSFALTLQTPDPYFYGNPLVLEWQGADDTPPNFFPFGPTWEVAPSQVLGETTVTNPGDQEAYAEWFLLGPMDSIVATLDTDTSWSITHTLQAGESITVKTNPREAGIITGSGQRLGLDNLTDELWAIPYGTSEISLEATGTTTESFVSASFRPRYESS